MNARITTTVPKVRGGRNLELTADIINLPNLLGSRWGRQRDITAGPSVTLLTLGGWDSINNRGQYLVPPRLPARGVVDDASSRWRGQVGARYYLR